MESRVKYNVDTSWKKGLIVIGFTISNHTNNIIYTLHNLLFTTYVDIVEVIAFNDAIDHAINKKYREVYI